MLGRYILAEYIILHDMFVLAEGEQSVILCEQHVRDTVYMCDISTVELPFCHCIFIAQLLF